MELIGGACLSYKDVYDDDFVDISELIKGIPSNSILQFLSYLMVNTHLHERDQKAQIGFLELWTGRFPSDDKKRIFDATSRLLESGNAHLALINNLSILMLIENVFAYYNDSEPKKDLTPEEELNLFKAYLLCSQKWISEQVRIEGNVEKEEDLVKWLLPNLISQTELYLFKDFRPQLVKASYFYNYCENDKDLKSGLTQFIESRKLKSWSDHLYHILGLYINATKNKSAIMQLSENDDFLIPFLKQLCLHPNEYAPSRDFLSLREKPIFEYRENEYIFFNLNFLIDKLYQGIVFDFSYFLINNEIEIRGKKLKNHLHFKSLIGEGFSEKTLFYSVLEYIIAKQKYISFKGEELREVLKESEPDYYIRDKAKIYLFEFKDTLIKSDVKYSHNIDAIKAELDSKLIENIKGEPKGIRQLINNIIRINNGDYLMFDDLGKLETVIIYPILVYQDSTLDTPGINSYITKKFNGILADKKIKSMFQIKPPVLINLDSIIMYQDAFHDKQFTLNYCFNHYYDWKRDSDNLIQKIGSFKTYLDEIMPDSYRTPRIIKEIFDKISIKER